jgi:hypothetical protein
MNPKLFPSLLRGVSSINDHVGCHEEQLVGQHLRICRAVVHKYSLVGGLPPMKSGYFFKLIINFLAEQRYIAEV